MRIALFDDKPEFVSPPQEQQARCQRSTCLNLKKFRKGGAQDSRLKLEFFIQKEGISRLLDFCVYLNSAALPGDPVLTRVIVEYGNHPGCHN